MCQNLAKAAFSNPMSAPKKSKSKSINSPAPATKSVAKKAPTATAATVQAATPTPVAMLAPAIAAATTPSVKTVATASVQTTISARIDVGFGNALFIRGEGPGLSWDKGLAMECVQDDLWRITLSESARAFTFKLLINDTTWSVGPDFSAACGTSVTLTPEF
jgi:hypothetical protein